MSDVGGKMKIPRNSLKSILAKYTNVCDFFFKCVFCKFVIL